MSTINIDKREVPVTARNKRIYATYSTSGGSSSSSGGGGTISAQGTEGTLAKWLTGTSLGDSSIYISGTNVGFGTKDPSSQLHMFSSISGYINELRIENSNTNSYGNAVTFYSNNASSNERNWAFLQDGNNLGTFGIVQSNAKGGNPYISGTYRMFLAANGDVGFGTTTPQTKFHLNATNWGEWFRISNNADETFYHSIKGSWSGGAASSVLSFYLNNGTANTQVDVMDLSGDGSVKIAGLAGSGTRYVVSSPTGVLGTSSTFEGKLYMDGSLNLRDVSIDALKNRVNITDTSLSRLDASVKDTVDGRVYFLQNSSLNTNKFTWNNGLLEPSINTGGDITKLYVDGSLGLRDSSIAKIDASIRNTFNLASYVNTSSYYDTSINTVKNLIPVINTITGYAVVSTSSNTFTTCLTSPLLSASSYYQIDGTFFVMSDSDTYSSWVSFVSSGLSTINYKFEYSTSSAFAYIQGQASTAEIQPTSRPAGRSLVRMTLNVMTADTSTDTITIKLRSRTSGGSAYMDKGSNIITTKLT